MALCLHRMSKNVIINVFLQSINMIQKKTQNKSEVNLINSRKGIDIDSNEFQILDKIVKMVLIIKSLFIKLQLKIKMQ